MAEIRASCHTYSKLATRNWIGSPVVFQAMGTVPIVDPHTQKGLVTRGLQVSSMSSIYQGKSFWGYPPTNMEVHQPPFQEESRLSTVRRHFHASFWDICPRFLPTSHIHTTFTSTTHFGVAPCLTHIHVSMGQNPNRTPSEHPPITNATTKIDSKMGGEFTYQPKWDPNTF